MITSAAYFRETNGPNNLRDNPPLKSTFVIGMPQTLTVLETKKKKLEFR